MAAALGRRGRKSRRQVHCQVVCDAPHFRRGPADQGSGGLVPRRFHAARETCSQGVRGTGFGDHAKWRQKARSTKYHH